MASWVWSDYWGAFVADMGPYIGPWPPAPPIPSLIPSDAYEIDYVVILPNPSGNTARVYDFSYDSYYVERSRWIDNTSGQFRNTDFHYGWMSGSGGPGPSGDPAMQPGSHFFVLLYPTSNTSTPPPSVTPEAVTPSLYAAAGGYTDLPDPGTGALGSAESAYEYDLNYSFTNSATRESTLFGPVANNWQAYRTYPTDTSQPDRSGDIPAMQAELVANSGADLLYQSGNTVGDNAREAGGKVYMDLNTASTNRLTMAQCVATASAVTIDQNYNATTPLAWPLIEGIDFCVVPNYFVDNVFVYRKYEGPITFMGWGQTYFKGQIECTVGGTDPISGFSYHWRAAFSSGAPASLWPAYGVGTQVDSHDGTFAGTGSSVTVENYSSSPRVWDTTINGATEITVYFQFDYLGSRTLPYAALPSGGLAEHTQFSGPSMAGLAPVNLTSGVSYIVGRHQVPVAHTWVPGPARPSAPPVSWLRLNQRDDGLGVYRHPRINVGPNSATSGQYTKAPRVGDNNIYW